MVTGIGNFFLAAAPIHPGRDRATPTTPFEIDGATQVWHSSARYAQFRAPAYLQLGQDQQAKRIVDGRNSVTEYPANFRYSGHAAFAAILVRYAFERAAWAEAAALAIPKTPFAQAGRSPGSAVRSAPPAAEIRRRPRSGRATAHAEGQPRQGE